jgi:adenylate cyclase
MVGSKKIRITLTHLIGFSLLGLIALLGFLFYLFMHTSQASVIQSSNNLRAAASREFAEKVTAYLNQLQQVEDHVQAEINHEVFNPTDPIALETFLFTSILTNSNLSEISLTYGDKIGYDADGNILLAPTGRGEMSLFRTSYQDSAPIDTLFTYQIDEEWVSEQRTRSAENDLFGAPFAQGQKTSIEDPTKYLTFITPANKQYAGKSLWSDLHWSQIDRDIPENQRRVEVSVQRTVTDSKGNFLGVLRVGLFYNQIDLISTFKLVPQDPQDPHLIFITDSSGELITRLSSKDTLRLIDDDLRFSSTNAPFQVQMALKNPALGLVTQAAPLQSSQFDYQGKTYLLTYRKIEGSQGWILGVVVPQSYYVGALQEMRNRLLLMAGIIICCISFSGFFVQRSLKREQQKIIDETLKMHNFDFQPSVPHSIFEDVYTILSGLELAKTAMRAMSKYVPVELVKHLFQSQKDPVLGGEVQEISILFTDIQNFTSLAEKLPVNDLANALGSYLKVMTQVIQNRWHGIIDKYIGDGIMVLWNTPSPLPNHAQIACQAILDCTAALQELFASSQWQGLPRFETRFGLHKDQVMVGHFGAPDRLNFTALGNGVNIASRLESLNKYYGTSIIVSENIYKEAQNDFVFRLLDFIMLKGETEKITVYELIGKKGEKAEMSPIIAKYEQALDAYRKRLFTDAMHLLQDQLHDGPSHTLHARCSQFLQNPPPAAWDGSYVFIEK